MNLELKLDDALEHIIGDSTSGHWGFGVFQLSNLSIPSLLPALDHSLSLMMRSHQDLFTCKSPPFLPFIAHCPPSFALLRAHSSGGHVLFP